MKKLVALVIILLFTLSCTTQNVSVDFDRSANFNQFRTYSFTSVSSNINELDSARIYQALQQQLSLKAMHWSEKNADLSIVVEPKEYTTTKSNSSVGLGVGTGGRGFGGGLSVGIPITSKQLNQEYAVSMYKDNGLVWQGILTIRSGTNLSPEAKNEQVRKGVEKLLKNYPPR